MDKLSDLDAALLDFESRAPRSVGAKEKAIRENFDLSPVRYHQRLNELLDDPAALAAQPVLVGRLRRVRERRDIARRAARE
ncbi:Fis family transcriptional regulator [Corynebacterium phocae]|uniref:Fis family transcriptional regulator n=1 Tax=Corynebacterium phocae TaxID=161895 RepID=A0A1L7D6V2_9CORY|nr:DUF3263 domain-containing protein [Corynebacterium phocae]APT93797.1 Fis family transcriptional regulator [Corynebacterium phocae]KAA8721636.1 DUF3263 domain-containing protein [Corynebacterium phocae]